MVDVTLLSDSSPAFTKLSAVGFNPVAGLLHRLRTNQPVKFLVASSSSTAGYLLPSGTNTVEAPTAGNYQAAAEGAGRQMATQLAAKYGNTNTTVVNAGVAGATARDWLYGGQGGKVPALLRKLRVENPDAAIFQVNSNDVGAPWSLSAAQFEALLRSLFSEALRHTATLLVIPPYTHIAPGGEYSGYPAACYRAAVATGAFVVPIESALQGESIGTAATGTTIDGLHPSISGAALLGAAFAASFPTPANTISTVALAREPRATWDDPRRAGGFYEWITTGGVTRRHRTLPVADLDGWAATSPPKYTGTGLMLRDSLFLTDCVQDAADTTAIRDLSGHGVDGWLGAVKATTTDHPTWTTGGGLTFAGAQFGVIPLDALAKRDIVPGLDAFTVRVAAVAASAASPANVIARRGDASASPFALYIGEGGASTIAGYTRGNSGLTAPLPTPITSAVQDLIFTCWPYAGGSAIVGKWYANGVYIGGVAIPTTTTSGRDFNWTLGGRWTGTAQASGTPARQFNGTIHWVDIAKSYIQDDAEAASLYAALKTKLVADRSVTML